MDKRLEDGFKGPTVGDGWGEDAVVQHHEG